ncbi:FtsW/RodA/SpoVE family cell cycle protein, partial [Patescibacteria group bacterium]|nr:FtsW/RodA/SpoVE family cell cycle protein [Patescibacteria group bacterium]
MILHFKKLDWILIISVLVLCLVGSLTLFGIDAGEQAGNFFNKQILFVAIGAAVMFGLSFFDYRIFKNYTFIPIVLYVILLILLVLVLILGKEIRGTVGWFRLGEINFEPVE